MPKSVHIFTNDNNVSADKIELTMIYLTTKRVL